MALQMSSGTSEAVLQVPFLGGNGKAFPLFPFLDKPFPFTAFLGFTSESREASESASDSSSELVDEWDGVLFGGIFLDFGPGFDFLLRIGVGDLEGL
jgi:hypothetical protein